MKKAIKTVHQLEAPVDALWSLIRTGAKWEDWLPILKDSRVEGTSRFCDLENGDTLEEKFLASDVAKTFIYNVHKQASFPADNIVAIMRLDETSAATTTLHWYVEMEVENEETFQGLKAMIEDLYTNSAKELQKLAAEKVAA